ncbi:corrinoid adenosyltransferase [Anaeramoeba flamelloides]|uniref:Corrinoid adenosyltransferase MMAB n=1 Tax=Anaeramoeba flamelloides TaxID=1746091 RepID=A0AAV8ACT7_9EUKA|nr:corrinoid adenosyltransferase [Anaeramoeba flamelloides]KAJ6239480.1 corrinoid adenosyltransferase [Anaeramoeba flamelloides]
MLSRILQGEKKLPKMIFTGSSIKQSFVSNKKPPKSIVYTRTGDKGKSSLFTGERQLKTSEVFEALGTVDELSSYVALIRVTIGSKDYKVGETTLCGLLLNIQGLLTKMGSHIATPRGSRNQKLVKNTEFSEKHTKHLEKWIDFIDSKNPKLKNFILPGSNLVESHLNICRSICRRAERRVLALVEKASVDSTISKFLNRLADFFFVAARFVVFSDGDSEIISPTNPSLEEI